MLPPQVKLHELDYASCRPHGQRRWIWRITVISTIILTAAFLVFRIPPVWGKLRVLYLQHQCAQYSPPVTEAVYELSGGASSRTEIPNGSIQARDAQGILRVREQPPCLAEYANAEPVLFRTSTPAALLFMHDMKSPKGDRFLVVVWRRHQPPADETLAASLRTDVYLPATFQKRLRCVFSSDGYTIKDCKRGPVLSYGKVLRFYAGQIDNQNPSHFTVKYALDGLPGMIDGFVDDAGRVRLTARDGPGKR